MPILPDRDVELIEFCETHTDVWASSATSIGLTAGQVTALTSLTNTARLNLTAALATRDAAKAATTTFQNSLTAMRSNVADLIRIIKGFAEASGDPLAIYGKAQIPPPAAPSPQPVPGKPTDIAVTLNPDGAVTLSWIASNGSASSGAFFNVSRKLPGQNAFVPIGGAPGTTSEQRRATFTDATVPTSAAGSGAQYIITPFRGTRTGIPSDAITVQFGVDGEGLSVTGARLRMAA